MDRDDEDVWSPVAQDWAALWGTVAGPVRRRIVEETSILPGSRVLDVGCGSGEFLALLAKIGADPSGVDPATAMLQLARLLAPTADIRQGTAGSLPWLDASFDVVTAINALQFADDADAALVELARVTVPGGLIAIANWAEGERNQLNVIETAVAASFGEDPAPDGEFRVPGGLDEFLNAAGFAVVASGLVELPWHLDDDDQLVRGVLIGEDAEGLAAGAATVIEAARPFRTSTGGYRLLNAFRFAVARTPPLESSRRIR